VLASVSLRQLHLRRCSRILHVSGTLTKMILLPTVCVQEVGASCGGGVRKDTNGKRVFNTGLRVLGAPTVVDSEPLLKLRWRFVSLIWHENGTQPKMPR
jgi:hypothetical protein